MEDLHAAFFFLLVTRKKVLKKTFEQKKGRRKTLMKLTAAGLNFINILLACILYKSSFKVEL
jgi:hypothetical protein